MTSKNLNHALWITFINDDYDDDDDDNDDDYDGYYHHHHPWYLLYAGSFIHLVVCLMTGPKPLPKQALHILRSRPSSFK